LGVGDRVTEILLREVSFEAIKEVFLGSDFTRIRPYRLREQAFDYVRVAQEAGPSIVQSFHERMGRRGGHSVAILRDVVAFANTNGGTVYIGVGSKPKSPVVGVDHPEEASRLLLAEITRAVLPPLEVDIDVLKAQGKNVLRLTVPKGGDAPYALHGVEIYVRQESETSRAMRDEIVQLIERVRGTQAVREEPAPAAKALPAVVETVVATEQPIVHPRTGVEIVDEVEREGTKYYSLKDLRNGNVVENVTRTSARRLWRYAITERETRPVKPDQVQWQGSIGLWKSHKRLGRVRYDFVQRDAAGKMHVYYGVSDDGIHSEWRQFVSKDK
jgi:hypothetical protein